MSKKASVSEVITDLTYGDITDLTFKAHVAIGNLYIALRIVGPDDDLKWIWQCLVDDLSSKDADALCEALEDYHRSVSPEAKAETATADLLT